jgi:hypothetical protein
MRIVAVAGIALLLGAPVPARQDPDRVFYLDRPGTWTVRPLNAGWSADETPAERRKALQPAADRVIAAMRELPSIRTPIGFEARALPTTTPRDSAPANVAHIQPIDASIGLFHLYRPDALPKPAAAVTIELHLNDLEILASAFSAERRSERQGGLLAVYDEDAENELQPPLLVATRRPGPVWVAVTRREFLERELKTAKEQEAQLLKDTAVSSNDALAAAAKEMEKTIAELAKTNPKLAADLRAQMAAATKAVAAADSGEKSTIAKAKGSAAARVTVIERALKTMPPKELAGAARQVPLESLEDELAAAIGGRLLRDDERPPAGTFTSWVKPNPTFFDPALPASAIQIVVYRVRILRAMDHESAHGRPAVGLHAQLQEELTETIVRSLLAGGPSDRPK